MTQKENNSVQHTYYLMVVCLHHVLCMDTHFWLYSTRDRYLWINQNQIPLH